MRILIRIWLLIALCYIGYSSAFATHNRAGEITYCHISGNTYSATVTTYTRDIPGGAITHSLYLFWGDGDSSIVVKSDSTRICDSITMNHYYGTHTYSGTGTYTLSITNPNRVADVCNIVNSVNIPFSINSTNICKADAPYVIALHSGSARL